MKAKNLLLVGCLTAGISLSVEAQIQNATQPIMGFGGLPANTGLAIAPAVDVQAAVHDDGFGNYQIEWIESATSSIVDVDGNVGNDPDVAYYSNADALVVAYENGGMIFVDDYYLSTLWPVPDYFMNTTTPVAPGNYPNVDMNSMGNGILCWEDGGAIWVCSFGIGTFTPGPPVLVAQGKQPDVIHFDDGATVGLTYIDLSGVLTVETSDYWAIVGGSYALWNQWQYPPMTQYEYPRIASQRNTAFGWGAPDDFTVVVQDFNGTTAEVHALFGVGGVISTPPILVNDDFMGCTSFEPRPVVAYERGRVHIAWSQQYFGACSGLTQSMPNPEDDILLRMYDAFGNTGLFYEEVNTHQSAFSGNSRHSISTEYDGGYAINNWNWHEGLIFNDPGDLLWKGRDAGTPNFSNQADPQAHRDDNFSLITSPVDQTIEVLSESDEIATFEMLDNAGRVVELKTVTNDGNVYSIDISHLSGGIYFLNCSSAAGQEVLRILQVTK